MCDKSEAVNRSGCTGSVRWAFVMSTCKPHTQTPASISSWVRALPVQLPPGTSTPGAMSAYEHPKAI